MKFYAKLMFKLVFVGFFAFTISVCPFSVLLHLEEDVSFRSLQTKVSAAIDTIIHDELLRDAKKKQITYELPEFRITEDPHVTLLYDRLMSDKFESSSILALRVMQSFDRGIIIPQGVELTSESDLFGFHGEFVVLKVHDKVGQLGMLRNDITSALCWLNAYYKNASKNTEQIGLRYYIDRFVAWIKSFFVPVEPEKSITDTTKWDRYPFTPHVTLGKLPQADIFKIASWQHLDAHKVWETIKERIKCEVFPQIVSFVRNKSLIFKAFYVYGKNYQLLQKFTCKPVTD